jgi:hypothetical protein
MLVVPIHDLAVSHSVVQEDAMATPKTRKALDDLAKRFSQESIGAIDYGANAKAIALQAENLRAAITEVLDQGYRLLRIDPVKGYGASPDNYVLALSFRKSDASSPIDLDEKALFATVDLSLRRVTRIDKEIAHAVRSMATDVPFVLAVPSRTSEATMDSSVSVGARQRETRFLNQLGIVDLIRTAQGDGWLFEGNNTFTDTPVDTSVNTDYESAYGVTDRKQDIEIDGHKIDGSVDREQGGWVDLPTDRPVVVLPRPPRPSPDPSPIARTLPSEGRRRR